MLKTLIVCAAPLLLAFAVANFAAHKINDVANAVAASQVQR